MTYKISKTLAIKEIVFCEEFAALEVGPIMPRRRRGSSDHVDHKQKKARSSTDFIPGEKFSRKRCLLWFHEYTSVDNGDLLIGPEGMEKFCEDIGVEPENIVMLCLAYKLNAHQMGFFTKEEWLEGMSELQCDSVDKQIRKLDTLKMLLDDSVEFKNIYQYAFDFARESDKRSLDLSTAKTMLGLLLGRTWSLYGSFKDFLEQSKYKIINKDQWCNILEFSRNIVPDLSNYDEDGAWPVMLDEFVEWFRGSH